MDKPPNRIHSKVHLCKIRFSTATMDVMSKKKLGVLMEKPPNRIHSKVILG